MDSDRYVLIWTVQIERQNTLSGAFHDQLHSGAVHSGASGPGVMAWNRMMGRLQHIYITRKFPSQNDWQHKPIVLEMIPILELRLSYMSYKFYTSEAKVTDGYLRFVSDELFDYPEPITCCQSRAPPYFISLTNSDVHLVVDPSSTAQPCATVPPTRILFT
ncbi:hypothetical protein RUM44_003502 [Polyplax serrata]|uniref:Uncharacterized protein n=1 Tax=Polyplax serrata TaxID=468196 RepID=A0ABR1AGN3_POLSC